MKYSPQKSMYWLAFFGVLSLLIVGCILMKLRGEVKYGEKATVLVGNVSSNMTLRDMPVVVAAYSKNDGKRKIVHYATLHEPGPYELMVPEGPHNIVAFIDKNRNLIYDKGEPSGQILRAEQVPFPAGGVVGNLDVVVTEQNSKKIDFPIGSEIPPKAYRNFHSTCPGAIANMEDDLFSDDYGKKGFWTPLAFFKEIGGNVYFLEAYDSKKTPILFVHGAAGSPQNWRTLPIDIEKQRPQRKSPATDCASIFRLIFQKSCQGPCRLFFFGLSTKKGLKPGFNSNLKIQGKNTAHFHREIIK